MARKSALPPQGDPWERNEWGERIIRPFKNAPFPHSSREQGFTYQDKHFPRDPHYIDSSLGVFIPQGFKPGKTVDFMMYFHGWQNSVEGVFAQFEVDKQFFTSGANAVLLVVQGPKNASDSGGGRLQHDPGAFAALIEEALAYLKQQGKAPGDATIGKIALGAHSGGYKMTSFILKHGGLTDNITDVLLFDASYWDYENFVAWSAGDKDRRLVSIFTEHLRENNLEIMALMTKADVCFRVLNVKDSTPKMFAPRGPAFIFIPDELQEELGHNDVVSKMDFMALWVGTSALAKK